ncbi:MAG: hypothetical protein ACKVOU_14770 [Cytophagales bacterium]
MQIHLKYPYKLSVYFLACIIFTACQTNEFLSVNPPLSVGSNSLVSTEASFVKFDTTYSDTSDTKNTKNIVYKALTVTTLGGVGTVIGNNLQTDVTLLIIRQSVTGIVFSTVGVSTVVGTTITGFKTEIVARLFSLVTTLPGILPKTDASHINLITFNGISPSATEVVYRDGTQNATSIGVLSGNAFTEVPPDFLKLLTQDNKPLSATTQSDVRKGWQIIQVTNVSRLGGTSDVTNAITLEIIKATSGVLTYFPDGYYTFVSAIDPINNQFGWYRISMAGNTPLGIVYDPEKTGANFTDAPRKNSQPVAGNYSGYGIWGISNTAFYPIFRLDRDNQAILTTKSIEY